MAKARLSRLFPHPRRRSPIAEPFRFDGSSTADTTRGPNRPPATPPDLTWALTARPGWDLARALSSVDALRLDHDGRALLLQGWERVSRWVAARQCEALVALAGRRPATRDDFSREEVRLALLGCGGSPKASVDTARLLCGPGRPVLDAMERGELSYDHARVVAQETGHLDPVTTAAVADGLLRDLERRVQRRVERTQRASQRAEERSARAAGRDPVPVEADPISVGEIAGTPGRFRRLVRAAVIGADPLAAELEAQEAGARRSVIRESLPDAQASLRVCGPATGVATIWTALDLRAGRPVADDLRTLDQRRFDALVALCADALSGRPAPALAPSRTEGADEADDDVPSRPDAVTRGPERSTRGRGSATRGGLVPGIYVFADAPTWAGLVDGAVELDGYGPIPVGIAREHFTDSVWRAMVTDTVSGTALAVCDGTYRPSARTRRHLHARDRSCAFPGCHAAIWFCDADHNVPHADGGCTDADNCGLMCRRHHRLKTFTRWQWRRIENDVVEWTSPTGRRWYRHGPSCQLPPAPPTELPTIEAPQPPDGLRGELCRDPADDPPPF